MKPGVLEALYSREAKALARARALGNFDGVQVQREGELAAQVEQLKNELANLRKLEEQRDAEIIQALEEAKKADEMTELLSAEVDRLNAIVTEQEAAAQNKAD
jgi:hypothetical protein